MKTVIYSNYYSVEHFEETKRFMFEELNDIYQAEKIDDICDDDIFRRIDFENNFSWESAEHELANFLDGETWLVFGTFGGWQGRQSAGKIIHSLDELSAAWNSCDYLELVDNNDHFHIKCSHHDGTNYYELKRITGKGIDVLEANDYSHDFELHETLFNYNFFSGLPYFARQVYGIQ